MISAGELNKRITIEKKVTKGNGRGGVCSVEWEEFATIWAAILPLSGREIIQAEQLKSEITGRVKMRFMPGISPEMRIKFGNRIFNIAGIINTNEANRELILMVKEVA